jgi:hypothetical protein
MSPGSCGGIEAAVATISVDGPLLRVTFPAIEKVLGLVRDYEVPLASVRGARRVGEWRDDLRGVRVGLGLPNVWLLGRWISRGHRQLVALRRNRPAVCIALSGERYDELLIETPDPDAFMAALPRLS